MTTNVLKSSLKKHIKANDAVNLSINSVAKSGMSRTFSVYGTHKGQIVNITNQVIDLLGDLVSKRGCRWGECRVSGCGMDMAFWLTITIKRYLYPRLDTCTNTAQRYNLING